MITDLPETDDKDQEAAVDTPRLSDEQLMKLAHFASVLEFSGPNRPLVIAHGECRIRLDPDGTISITGKRILQDAERNISLRGGWIDLN
ncbi:hypothetical protein [Paracoccus pacificus]|uniref:Uncharacterized protein n=1 Tax=Paracoccus pacificus TaxID=1463598 RepID=A0ABW4R5N2_9RHOB